MPEVIVYLLEGRTVEAKRSLVKDLTDAVVKNHPEMKLIILLVDERPEESCSATCRRVSEPGV